MTSPDAICREENCAFDCARQGILIGTAFGGITSFAGGCETIATSTVRKMNPFCIPFAISNMGGAMLAMDTGAMGPNYSINTACATGNYCMLNGYDHIQNGEADIMLVRPFICPNPCSAPYLLRFAEDCALRLACTLP